MSCVSSRRTQVFFYRFNDHLSCLKLAHAVTHCVCLSEDTACFVQLSFSPARGRLLENVGGTFLNSLSSSEIHDLLRSAQNVNTQKATSLWLRAVTSFRQEKNVDISFGTCSKKELDQFLCQFYMSLRPKKPGVEYSHSSY